MYDNSCKDLSYILCISLFDQLWVKNEGFEGFEKLNQVRDLGARAIRQ